MDGSIDQAKARIQVDDLQFTMRRSARRRIMQITFERDGELVLSASPEVGEEQLCAGRGWLNTELM